MKNATLKNIILLSLVIVVTVFIAAYLLRMEPGKQLDEGHGHGGHEENHENESHDGHDHDSEPEPERMQINPKALQEAGVKLYKAGAKTLRPTLALPGEISLNQDTIVHISPPISGAVTHVNKQLGDMVSAGDLLAVIHSRELARLTGQYLGAVSNLSIVQSMFDRESALWKARTSAEQDFLNAKRELQQARIEQQVALQELITVGIAEATITQWRKKPPTDPARFEIKAASTGQITEKHINLGEFVQQNTRIFTIADLSMVWAEASVYATDRVLVKIGQEVKIQSDALNKTATGKISYISPVVGEKTQSAHARVVIDNSDNGWYPGLFVNMQVNYNELKVDLAVPETALQEYEGQTVVFVKQGKYLVPRPINLGRSGEKWVEVLDGLEKGVPYVAKNSFLIKADLGKSSAEHSH